MTDIDAEGLAVRVLVIDDHADTIEALSTLLQALGHQVRGAQRGKDALRMAHDFDPHLILVDIGLPDVSGYEVVGAMRAEPGLCDRFIVALTGYGQSKDIARASAAGFSEHVIKPVDLATIQRLLQTATRATPFLN
jgi:CheY-like chemotaxis protein